MFIFGMVVPGHCIYTCWRGKVDQDHNNHCINLLLPQLPNSVLKIKIIHKLLLLILSFKQFSNLNSWEGGSNTNDSNHCNTLFLHLIFNSVQTIKITHKLLQYIISKEFCNLIVWKKGGIQNDKNSWIVFSIDVSLSTKNQNNTEITFQGIVFKTILQFESSRGFFIS